MFTLKCFNGSTHNGDFLIEIYAHGSDDEAVSIKWCTECGAVVGDVEVDGRRMGRIFNMKWPNTANLRTRT